MTTQEAAEMIRDDMKLHHDSLSGEYRKALSMAISALQAQEAKNSTESSLTQKALDTISRQSAIDALHTWFRDGFDEDCWWNSTHVLAALEGLPSAQPEPHWISVNENQPEKYGWYLCSLKDGRVNTLYWHNRKGWIDNVRMYMFELYDIRSKLTGNEVNPENESVYWNDWVKAWMPLPEPYREDGGK